MAEIRFREIEGILKETFIEDKDFVSKNMLEGEGAHHKALCEGQEPLYEEKIALCLGVPEHLMEEADEIILSLIGSVSEEMDLAFSYLDEVLYARIFDGDLLFVRKQDSVDDGEIAVVLIDDEATVKRVYFNREDGILTLMPENPTYKPMRYMGRELDRIRILGKVVSGQYKI